MVATVETAVYQLSYQAGDSVQQVRAVHGAVKELTASTKEQAASEEQLSRARRTATGELREIRVGIDQTRTANDNLAKSWQSLGSLFSSPKSHPLGRNFQDPALTRLGDELEKIGLKGAVVTGALVRTRFGMVQLSQPAQQVGASISGINVALSQLERQAEPAVQAAAGVSRSLMLIGAGSVIAGILAAVNAVKGFATDLADLDRNARRARLSTADFQTGQFAAAVGGASAAAFNESVKGIADKLSEAAKSENALTRLLDANNVKWKERGQVIIDTNKALGIAADLIRRASSEEDKEKIADRFGISKEMIPALERGTAHFRALQQQGRELGVVIDNDIIEKAKQFDEQWKAASARSSAYIRAWAAMAINAITDVLNSSGSDRPKSPAEMADNLTAWLNSTLPKAASAIEDVFVGLQEKVGITIDPMSRVVRTFESFKDGGIPAGIKSTGDAVDSLNNSVTSLGQNAPSWMNTIRAHLKFWTASPGAGKSGHVGGPTTIVPDEKDAERARAWENEIKRINRHTATMIADAAAVGQGEAAQARFRAELRLLEAAQRAGLGVTDEQIDRYAELRNALGQNGAMVAADIKLRGEHAEAFKKVSERAAEAARILAESRIRSEAGFERDTMFLSPGDQSIAQRLRPVFGSDVASALKSREAAMLRFNEQMRTAIDLSTEFATGFVRDLRQGVGAIQALTNALNRLLDRLLDMVTQQLVRRALGGLPGFFGGIDPSQGSPGAGGAPFASAKGNVFAYGNVVPFRAGGIVDRPTIFPFARGVGLMGEAGPEAILPLARTPSGSLGVQTAGGSAPVFRVIVNNNAGAEVGVSEPRQNSDGSFDIDIAIERKVQKTISSGAADKSLRRVGGTPTVMRR